VEGLDLKIPCQKCGYFISAGARFCNQCGERLLPPPYVPPVLEAEPTAVASAPVTTRFRPEEHPLKPPPGSPPPAELAPNIAATLCYSLSIISGLIFLSLRPYSRHPFVRFHAYQSIYFFFAIFILHFIILFLSVPLPDILSGLMSSGLRLVAAGGTFWLMYQSYLGVRFKFPIIGDLAEAQSNSGGTVI